MIEHTHKCCCCGHEELCDGVGRGKVCEIDKAAGVNKRGPYCRQCRTGIEFIHICMIQKRDPAPIISKLIEHENQLKLANR